MDWGNLLNARTVRKLSHKELLDLFRIYYPNETVLAGFVSRLTLNPMDTYSWLTGGPVSDPEARSRLEAYASARMLVLGVDWDV